MLPTRMTSDAEAVVHTVVVHTLGVVPGALVDWRIGALPVVTIELVSHAWIHHHRDECSKPIGMTGEIEFEFERRQTVESYCRLDGVLQARELEQKKKKKDKIQKYS